MVLSLQHEQVIKSTQVTAHILTCLCCISPTWHLLSTVTKGADGGFAGGIGCHFCSWGSGEILSQEVYLNALFSAGTMASVLGGDKWMCTDANQAHARMDDGMGTAYILSQ